jgi:hypothetical protein
MSAFQSFRSWAANSTIAHVGFAFLVMGGWAVFANRAHTVPEMLLAGVVQGTVSALLTLGLKKFLEWIAMRLSATLRQAQRDAEGASARTPDRRQPEPVEGGAAVRRSLTALLVPPLITAASILAILFSAHTLAGTPEIGVTIAFPFSVSTLYAIVYNWGLWRRGA